MVDSWPQKSANDGRAEVPSTDRVRLDEGTIDMLGAARIYRTGFAHGIPSGSGPGLPIPLRRGNLGVNKPVIRWMSVRQTSSKR